MTAVTGNALNTDMSKQFQISRRTFIRTCTVTAATTGLPLWFVFGNNDFDRAGLQAAGAAMGAKCLGAFGDVTLAGKRIALFHGDDFVRRQRWVDSGVYDYALSGHTHKRLDGRRGRTREINPGALHRAAEKTVALLDLASDKLEFLTVEAGGSYYRGAKQEGVNWAWHDSNVRPRRYQRRALTN